MSITTCECLSTFSNETVKYLEKLVYNNKHEVSGELVLTKSNNTVFTQYEDLINCNCIGKYFTYVYLVSVDEDITNGSENTAEMIESRFNFHVHPQNAYKMYDCELGWPSMDDYITFLQTFLKYDTAYHCVVSIEGIYVISVNPNMVETIYSLRDQDSNDLFKKSLKKYINIDKTGYRIEKGYKMNGITINSGQTYQDAINTFKFPDNSDVNPVLRNKILFKIAFLDWKDLKNPLVNTGFCVTFPRINNTCEI
tara:strand:- start:1063 stop:1821 length:759 start_codon:yes stop_codon:yes gene_type:complete